MEEFFTKLATGLAGIGAGGYAVWRLLKNDKKSDGLDGKAQALIDNLESQLKREIDEKHKVGSVVDRLAAERNEAVQQLGRIQGVVEGLENEVKRMTSELVRVEERNKELSATVIELTSVISDLATKLAQLQTSNNEFINEIRASNAFK